MLIVMATMVVTSVMVVMLKIDVICQNLPKKWPKSCLGALPNKPSFWILNDMKVKVLRKSKQIIFWVRLFFWYGTIEISYESWGPEVRVWDGATYAFKIIMLRISRQPTSIINHHNFNEWKDATAPISLWLSVTPPLALSGSYWFSLALSGSYWISPSLSLGLSGFSFQTLLLCPSDDVFWGESFCLHTLGRNEIEIKRPNIVSIYKTIIKPW